MTKRIFEDRERALEYEFFHEVDQKLLAQLREKLEEDKCREGLQRATGIADEQVLDELMALGLSAESILALSMFPLVFTAWADGNVDNHEAAVILESAETVCVGRESAAFHLTETWLEDEPDERLFHVWEGYVQSVFKSLTPEARESLRHDIFSRAEKIAAMSGGVLGFCKISNVEHDALVRLSAVLNKNGSKV